MKIITKLLKPQNWKKKKKPLFSSMNMKKSTRKKLREATKLPPLEPLIIINQSTRVNSFLKKNLEIKNFGTIFSA